MIMKEIYIHLRKNPYVIFIKFNYLLYKEFN